MGKTRSKHGFRYNDIRDFRCGKPNFPQQFQQRSLYRKHLPYGCSYISSQNKNNTRRKNKFKKITSPIMGSSEHMNKKIEETSAIIMQQLLNPDETVLFCSTNDDTNNKLSIDMYQKPSDIRNELKDFNKINKKSSHKSDKIQEKIMNHLSNLTEGKKKNLINSDKTEYDLIIQQIMRQKRLDISRTLRNVFPEPDKLPSIADSVNFVNPDIGIKIEDLPQNLISELRQVLHFDMSETDKNTIDNCPDDVLLTVLHNFIQDFESPELCSAFNSIKSEEGILTTLNAKNIDITFAVKNEPVNQKCSMNSISEQVEESININKFIRLNDRQNTENKVTKCNSSNGKITYSHSVEEDEHVNQKLCMNLVSENVEEPININEFVLPTGRQSAEYKGTTPIFNPYGEIIEVKKEYNIESNNIENDGIKTAQYENITVKAESEHFEENSVPYKVNFMCSDMTRDNNYKDSYNTMSSVALQTEDTYKTLTIDKFIEVNLKEKPSSFAEAIQQMYQIDTWIAQLTSYRQNVFGSLESSPKEEINEK